MKPLDQSKDITTAIGIVLRLDSHHKAIFTGRIERNPDMIFDGLTNLFTELARFMDDDELEEHSVDLNQVTNTYFEIMNYKKSGKSAHYRLFLPFLAWHIKLVRAEQKHKVGLVREERRRATQLEDE